MKRIVYQVDAFTRERFRGNPAGVVIDASGMTEAAMLQVARELNISETAFFFPERDETQDCRIRYFTPSAEVPVCRHATIGSAYALWREGVFGEGAVRVRTGVGVLPVAIVRHGDSVRISMTQGAITISDELPAEVCGAIMAALGLGGADLDPRCRIRVASTGHSKVMIGLRSKARLDRLTPDMTSLSALSARVGSNGFFVFTLDAVEPDVLVAGRMFAPAIGIPEDPVTGNANGPRGPYLLHEGIGRPVDGMFRFRARQGEAIGRTGHVDVEVKVAADGSPQGVTIHGESVEVFRTEIEI